MDAPDVTRTTASRQSSGWIRGALAIFASGIAAVVVLGMLAYGDKPWTALPGSAAVLALGGVLAGLQANPPFSRRRFVAYLFMPAPSLAIAAFHSVIDWSLGGMAIVAVILGLWEAPLLVTLLVRSRTEQREHAERLRQRVPFGPLPLEGELAKATRDGRSPTVIREYIDDELGQKQLDADEVALLPHGYELVSVEPKEGRVGLGRDLGQLLDLLSWQLPDAESNNDRIVATFQRRPK